jgi:predicted nucleotidyltransferase
MNAAFSDRYGLTERDTQTLFGIFNKFQEVEDVYLYGSRAKRTHKMGSDIDLAIMNEGVSEKTMTKGKDNKMILIKKIKIDGSI